MSVAPLPTTEKSRLREALLAARRAAPAEDRARASAAICARVLALEAYRRARTIALHAPVGAEVDAGAVAEAALRAGKRLAWPRVDPAARAMRFALAAPQDLVPGPAGTREPPPGAPEVAADELDLVLVPGVAFDERCRRLGRGRGHYDATLAALPTRAFRAGLAFELQLVPAVPAEAHDVALDAVVTERRTILAPG